MARKPWGTAHQQRQGTQPWRPGSMIEAQQGNPFQLLQPTLARKLNTPLSPAPSGEFAFVPINYPIQWTAQTFNSSAIEQIISAQPNRVILIVQNFSPTTPLAVNFDQTAAISGASPNYVAQGILLLPGVSLFIDRWCPTGTVHVSASGAPCSVTQGFSGIGNIPEAASATD
jgi:hypothetical protein